MGNFWGVLFRNLWYRYHDWRTAHSMQYVDMKQVNGCYQVEKGDE